MVRKPEPYSFLKLIAIAYLQIQSHFCSISEGRDIDLRSLITKVDNMSFGVNFWKVFTQHIIYSITNYPLFAMTS